MPKLYSSLSIIALLAMSSALNAQDATENSATETSGDSATVQEQSSDSSSAENTSEAAAQDGAESNPERKEQPSIYIAEQYGDWQIKCFAGETDKDPCNMYQLLSDEGGNPVATMDLFKLPKGQQAVAGATVAVPLRTLLTENIKIAVDGARAKVYNIIYCDEQACYAQLGFTQDDINAFKAGNQAVMQIVPAQAPERVVNIGVSLDGFTAAYGSDAIANE